MAKLLQWRNPEQKIFTEEFATHREMLERINELDTEIFMGAVFLKENGLVTFQYHFKGKGYHPPEKRPLVL